ncbi:MAG: hypothetical protein ACR2HF_09370, partial [Methylococcaceae bacterium]
MLLVSKCRTLTPLSLILLPALAQATDWNCQRNEKTSAWVCSSTSKTPDTTPTHIPATVQSSSPATETQPKPLPDVTEPASPRAPPQTEPQSASIPDHNDDTTPENPQSPPVDQAEPKPGVRPKLDGSGRRPAAITAMPAPLETQAKPESNHAGWSCRAVKDHPEQNWDCTASAATTTGSS